MSIGPVGGAVNNVPLAAQPAQPKNARLDKATKDFEAIWLSQILREARPKGGMFNKSFAAETFQDMMGQALGQHMADSGKLGFGKMLYDHLLPHVTAAATGQGVGAGDEKQSLTKTNPASAAAPAPDS